MYRNGPLGIAWLAAHVERKVLQSDINGTSISLLVDEILFQSSPPPTLRVLAFLLLGLARIHSKKVSFTLSLCHETVEKLKKAQLYAGVEQSSPEMAAIGELIFVLDSFDELSSLQHEHHERDMELHVARPEQITLQQSHEQNGWTVYFDPEERLPAGTLHLDLHEFNMKEQEHCPELTQEAESEMSERFAGECFEPRTPPALVLADHILRQSPDRLLSPSSCERSPPAKTALNFDKLVDNSRVCLAERLDSLMVEARDEPQGTIVPVPCLRSMKRKYSYCPVTARKRRRVTLDLRTVLTSEYLHQQNMDTKDLLRSHNRVPLTYRELAAAQKRAEKTRMFSKLSVSGIYGGLFYRTALTLEISLEATNSSCTPSKGNTSSSGQDAQAQMEMDIPRELDVSRQPDQSVVANSLKNNTDDQCDVPTEWGSEYGGNDLEGDGDAISEWSSRAKSLALYLKEKFKLSSAKSMTFDQVLTKPTRRSAARLFFDILDLKSKQRVHVEQAAAFNDITIFPLDL